MRHRRGVAYDAADEETETQTEPAPTGGKVAVWASLADGWVFLFRKFPWILARVWLAAILLAVLNSKLSVKIDPDTAGAAAMNGVLWMSVAYFALYFLVSASLYALALGESQQSILAGFAIGPDELRYLLTLVIYAIVALLLLVGALLVGQQIVKLLAYSGGIAQLSTNASLDDVQWFKDMSLLEIGLRFGPVAIASLLLLWFSLRYTFVPLHVIATHRFALFDGMALSKGNTWRLFGLLLLLFVILELVAGAIVVGIEAAAGAKVVAGVEGLVHTVRAFGEAAVQSASYHTQHITIAKPRSLPAWFGSTLSTVLNLMAIAVTTGTLASAYKRVTGKA